MDDFVCGLTCEEYYFEENFRAMNNLFNQFDSLDEDKQVRVLNLVSDKFGDFFYHEDDPFEAMYQVYND